MDEKLNIGLVQYSLKWLDKEGNLEKISELILNNRESIDLYVLPEMFNTGFHTHPEPIAEALNGPSVQRLIQLAKIKDSKIAASLCTLIDGKYYNTFVLVSGSGILSIYHKAHLFSYAHENDYFTPGQEVVNIALNSQFAIRPFICYDIRFPVWLRNNNEYDVLIGVANFPKSRINHWIQLCKARAIENQCYLIAVNGLGRDLEGIEYGGHSMVINADGQILIDTKEEEGMYSIALSKSELKAYRNKYPFLLDGDAFTILENE
ncbi:amidohydrolase [Membranihabitans marinus]